MFFFFIGLVFINLFLYTSNYVFLIFLFIDIFFLARKCQLRLLLIVVMGVLLFYTININYYNFFTSRKYVSVEFEVIEKYDNYSIVEGSEGKYLIYNNNHTFYEGSLIYLKGDIKCIKDGYNSFYIYLNKKGVNYEILIPKNKDWNEDLLSQMKGDEEKCQATLFSYQPF